MKKILFVALIAISTLYSCQKDVIKKENRNNIENVISGDGYKISNWAVPGSVSQETDHTIATYTAIIEDNAITADIIERGIVLVFTKNSRNTARTLPFTENGKLSVFQTGVSKIYISQETAITNDQEFRYIILSEAKMNKIEEKGVLVSDLLNMEFEKVLSTINS